MKRQFWVATLCLLLLFSLAGCKEKRNEEQTNSITTVYFELHGLEPGKPSDHASSGHYTVDTSNKTILDPNNKSYSYSIERSGIEITFPDGSVYTCHDGTAVRIRSGTDGGYRDIFAVDLATIIRKARNSIKASNSGSVSAKISNQELIALIVCVIMVGLGIFSANASEKGFEFITGWKYKNLEPSSALLNTIQNFGVGMVLLGSLMFLYLIGYLICH